MATLLEIEKATKHYADNRELLILRVQELHDQIEELKRKAFPAIKQAAVDTANAKSKLDTLIDGSRGLFGKPRSVIYSGVKVGLQKGKGGLDYDDEATVIRLIRKHLPEEQQEFLIRVTEKVNKKGLGEVDTATLKKIGVTVQGTGDVVLIKPVDSDVDKIVNAMLKAAAGDEEEMEDAT
jgi:hypothetical protein